MAKRSVNNFSGINNPIVGATPNNADPESKFYNKTFYNPDLDYENELDTDVRLYGREIPDELDYTDVWESSY